MEYMNRKSRKAEIAEIEVSILIITIATIIIITAQEFWIIISIKEHETWLLTKYKSKKGPTCSMSEYEMI